MHISSSFFLQCKPSAFLGTVLLKRLRPVKTELSWTLKSPQWIGFVQGLAFVGGEIVTNDGILSLGIQGEWIARLIAVSTLSSHL